MPEQVNRESQLLQSLMKLLQGLTLQWKDQGKDELSFEAFMAAMLQVNVLWVVTVHCVVVGYQCFRGSCCLHLAG